MRVLFMAMLAIHAATGASAKVITTMMMVALLLMLPVVSVVVFCAVHDARMRGIVGANARVQRGMHTTDENAHMTQQ
jgi:hypothetical protein